MANAILLEKNNVFTEYPSAADEYFSKKEVIFSKLPLSIRQDIESGIVSFRFTSAKEYADYLNRELSFWEEHDPDQKLIDYTGINAFKNALREFQQAIDYYRKGSSGDNTMGQSIQHLSGGRLCSKTRLAKFCVNNIDKNKSFFNGFMSGLAVARNNTLPSNIDAIEGFIAALEYSKVIKQLISASKEDILNFDESAKQATQNFEQLNAAYTSAFHDHETKLQEFSSHIDQQFQTISTETQKYFKEKEQRCNELEALYEEKLKLQAPAEYWAEMDKKYTNRGRLWLGISIGVTVLIVALLIAVLAFLPDLFVEASHWFEMIKNSAIITVITSIAVYMLRLFVKLSISSFHLASDARERNKLTYFYLALIEKKAVTEKERAIVLNSLFSRADTGMLKGDSSPTMSGNITDLVQHLNGK